MSFVPLLASEPPIDIGISPGTAILLAALFVGLNGFFVAAEFALVKVRPTQIEPHLLNGGIRARLANQLIHNLDAYLSASQLGITLASLALGWVGEPAFARILDPLLSSIPGASPAVTHTVALITAFTVITVLHIVIGEQVPKVFAIRKPASTSLWISVPLHGFYRVTYPAIWLLNTTANSILRLLGIKPVGEHGAAHSSEELRRLLASNADTNISEHKRELLDNVFELSERSARQIMLPRSDVVFLSTERTMAENLSTARRSGHTRFPLCESDLDDVSGIVHIKDLFQADDPPASLTEIRRAISFVPETLTADRLLRRMRIEKVHMAAVLDEFGGVSGIVTLENVLEEIVGEIQDEFDTEPPEIVKLGQGHYHVSGSVLIAELEAEVGFELSDRDEDTIAGVMLSELGRRARVGDKIRLGDLDIVVKEISGNRIKGLEMRVATDAAKAADAAASVEASEA